MPEPRDPLLLDHEADGIQELDNNLPQWWVWMFILCTVYAFGYMGYYHVFNMGSLQAEEYRLEAASGEATKSSALARFETGLSTMEPSKDAVVLANGKRLYDLNCSPCHRADGGGLVGPNLCDDYWIHGSKFSDNLRVIVHGVTLKGMLAWKEMLPPADIHAVASYIRTLQGTHPPDPKPPENTQGPDKPNEFE